jgi:hypothetical protein
MKSAQGFTCVQLFVSDKGFIYMVPMTSKGEFPKALKEFCKEVGVPCDLICDPSGEQTSGEVKQIANNVAMNLKILEENTQHANLAELYIGIMKNAISRDLRETGCPLTFWCYATE